MLSVQLFLSGVCGGQGYAKTDATFLNWARKRRRRDGSTAVTALLLGSKIFFGWAGDSRGFVLDAAWQVSWVSSDHKPNRPDEMERIKKAGGACLNLCVSSNPSPPAPDLRRVMFSVHPLKPCCRESLTAHARCVRHGCWRVSTLAGMEFMKRRAKGTVPPGEKPPNQLAVSRAFGDMELKEPTALVSAVPEVYTQTLVGRPTISHSTSCSRCPVTCVVPWL